MQYPNKPRTCSNSNFLESVSLQLDNVPCLVSRDLAKVGNLLENTQGLIADTMLMCVHFNDVFCTTRSTCLHFSRVRLIVFVPICCLHGCRIDCFV